MFNKIKSFANLCVMTGNAKSDRQLVALGYLIFNRTKSYTDALKSWNTKPAAHKSFDAFKVNLRAEFHALRRVNALTIHDSNINMLRDMTNHHNSLSTALGEQLNELMKRNFEQVLNLLKGEYGNEEAPPIQEETINHTSATDMMIMLKEMQAKMDSLTIELANSKRTPPTPPGASNGPDINPITGVAFKRYCWTCGCCPH